jgi:hypothetical protein
VELVESITRSLAGRIGIDSTTVGKTSRPDRDVARRARTDQAERTRSVFLEAVAGRSGGVMTAATHDEVPVVIEGGGLEVRTKPIGGGMSVGYFRLPEGTDMGPALKGTATRASARTGATCSRAG